MNNIIITGGMEEPWEVENTDTAIPKEIILKNLAMGKLAYLGSQAGLQVNFQKEILQSIVDGTNLLSDRLDLIKAPLVWNSEVLNLGIDDQVGLKTSSPGFNGEKLVAASESMRNSGIDFGEGDHYQYFDINDQILKYVKISEVPFYPNIESASTASISLPTGSLYKIQVSGVEEYFIKSSPLFSLSDIRLTSSPIKFVIPSSIAQIAEWQAQKSYANSIVKTDEILLRKNLVFGKMISISDQKILDDPKISDEIKKKIEDIYKENLYTDIKVNFDTIQFSVVDFPDKKFYVPYPVIDLPSKDFLVDKKNIIYSEMSSGGEKKYYYLTSSGSKYRVDNDSIKPFINQPSATEVQGWRSQLVEKQILLSQRSSELQNFLNELIQTYNYTFDAATNLLRLLANVDTEIIRNI